MHRSCLVAAALAAFPLWQGAAVAHPGGLDASGCHHDRKRGGYHCHRPQRSAAVEAPVYLLDTPADRSFRNCTEARNAGAAPLRRGEPGYRPKLDRDNDGVACE
ncbi:excalibur calcium-binding domain-containing protein [Paracoccus marinus]|uniref:excalibur calcium-binding domain-containing protein n=1 Tax=Paracoccus marinus TaxID=288426 RepID=UPI00103C8C91|nr:excalibur calcium-binding domain-containing protein [Paracoccus marinus]GLS79262.1 hypothetical protein GCM10007893_00360 [Paracoccus marinus]